MRIFGYICLVLAIILIFIGIVLTFVQEDCYNKPIQDFFKSEVCTWLIKE